MEQTLVYSAAFPEAIILIGALLLLLIIALTKGKAGPFARYFGMGVIVASFIALWILGIDQKVNFRRFFIFDSFAQTIKLLILIASFVVLFISRQFMGEHKKFSGEFIVLLLFSVLGMMVMVSANDLISVYIGLELQSLALYVLAAFSRDSRRSSESGLKYFVLSSLASCLFLYGASLLYGLAGGTSFAAIASTIQEGGAAPMFLIGMVFVLTAIAFKVSAAPFHMWTPDVYQGAPTMITTFFAAAPKFAAIALLCRFCFQAFELVKADWQQIIFFISILSMVIGAFGALAQTNIKRLMAYSSIGHVGYMLVGLASANQEGVQAIVIYLFIYLLAVLGTFACILAMRRDDNPMEKLTDLAGLSQSNLMQAACLGILMFSMIGLPPLAGFFAKYFVFLAAIKAKLYILAILGVLTSVVAAYYYLKIIKIMFFDETQHHMDAATIPVKWVIAISTLFAVTFIFFMGYVNDYALKAAQSLVG